jgi:hypothetical protein
MGMFAAAGHPLGAMQVHFSLLHAQLTPVEA